MRKRLLFHSFAGVATLVLLATGCKKTLNETPVGPEGQDAAKAACEKVLAAADKGSVAQVWDGLSSRSQLQIKNAPQEEQTTEGRPAGKKYDEKAEAFKAVVELVGRKAKIKEVRGVPEGVLIVVERADGATRELSMVEEGGAWKLHLIAS
jgi:hypothetical protein